MLQMIRRFALSLAVAVPVAGFGLGATAQADPPNYPFTPFAIFQVIGRQLVSMNDATGNTTLIGPPTSQYYNAMGFNPADGYLYAIRVKSGAPHVVKIGSNGIPIDLGVPTGDSWGASPQFLAGDVDNSNQLVVLTTSHKLWKVNLSTLVATATTLSSGVPSTRSKAIGSSG